MSKTLNFNAASDPKLQCTCEHPGCDRRIVKQEVLNSVQKMRNDAGWPFVVTSGGRCPYHENESHRQTPGDHQKCNALDIRCHNGFERGELVKLALKHGFNAIGVHENFVHVAKRENSALVMWVY